MADNEQFYYELPREAMRPTWRAWLKHLAFFALTFCTVTIAGSIAPFGPVAVFPNANPQDFNETLAFLATLPAEYAQLIVGTVKLLFTDAEVRTHGLSFSLSLLFILTCHEFGHYIACRLYGVDATLPFFLPTPPLIGPAGTFGAFIKIVSPLPSRKATFDIGVAGPIAGFIAMIPIAVVGVLTMKQLTPEYIALHSGGLYFSDSLFTHFVAWICGKNLAAGSMNAFSSAAWIGILVTALNLTPSGQLDGGHAIYAVFGETVHRWTGRIAFVAMIVLSICGLYFFSSPSGILFAILLGVMLRVSHPEPLDDSPLDARRKVVALVTFAIYILCFTPFPVQVTM